MKKPKKAMGPTAAERWDRLTGVGASEWAEIAERHRGKRLGPDPEIAERIARTRVEVAIANKRRAQS
jgi:hypothetical protein